MAKKIYFYFKLKKMSKGPISQFIQHHYRNFNAAALADVAKGYETHLLEGGKMKSKKTTLVFITLINLFCFQIASAQKCN